MVNRLVSVGDDFKLPAAVKVEDPNLPARLGAGELSATYGPDAAGMKAAYVSAAKGATFAQTIRPVADRTSFSPTPVTDGGRSNGTDTGGNYRMFHNALVPFHGLRLAYTNVQNNGGLEGDGANSITVRAAIDDGFNRFFPVRFGGKRDVVIEPGATVISDPLGFSAGPNDPQFITGFYTRTFVTVASAGMTWPLQQKTTASEGAMSGTTQTDLTTSGTITAAAGVTSYGPAAVLGIPEAPSPFVGIVGDSIAAGYSDTASQSFIARALTALKIPYINLALASESPVRWNSNTWRNRRAHMLRYCTHVVVEHGVNGLADTQALVLSQQQAVWDYIKSLDLPVIQTTITPRNTSTDAWVTTANQTPGANEAKRLALNALIRSNPAPLSAVIEVADIAESARDSGKWKVDGTANKWTNDGVHPSTYAHQQIDAGIRTQLAAALGI